MSKNPIMISLAVAMVGILACTGMPGTIAAGDLSSTFMESFSTTTYRDQGNTNASGWGVDYVRLPSKPVSCTSTANSSASPMELDIAGDYAYVASLWDQVEILDITNRASITRVNNISRTGMQPYAIDVDSSYLYVAGGSGGLFVFSIITPTSPSYENAIDNGGTYIDVKVAGTTAYCAATTGGLRVYNITNPSSPSLTSTHADGSDYNGLAVAGNYLYVAESNGLAVYNLTANPKSPVFVTKLNLNDFAWDVKVVGSLAYVALDGAGGLVIVDVSNPGTPAIAGQFNLWGTAYDVDVAGNYAFLACNDGNNYNHGLVVLGISNPAAITLKGVYGTSLGSAGKGVLVSGNFTYVCTPYCIDAFDVAPLFTTMYAPSATAQSLAIETRSSSSVFWSATITITATIPASTQITLFLSADGGSHWEAATTGVEHVFTTNGTDIRWRAVLATASPYTTPVLDTVDLYFTYTKVIAPTLVSPANGTIVHDSSPTLVWAKLGTLDGYILQVSVDSDAFTTLLCNLTVYGTGPTITHMMTPPITKGHVYYWRVAAIDEDFHVGNFSEAWSLQYVPNTTGPGGTVDGYAPLAVLGAIVVAVAFSSRNRRT